MRSLWTGLHVPLKAPPTPLGNCANFTYESSDNYFESGISIKSTLSGGSPYLPLWLWKKSGYASWHLGCRDGDEIVRKSPAQLCFETSSKCLHGGGHQLRRARFRHQNCVSVSHKITIGLRSENTRIAPRSSDEELPRTSATSSRQLLHDIRYGNWHSIAASQFRAQLLRHLFQPYEF